MAFPRINGVPIIPNGALIQVGTGTATAVVGGVLTVSTTQVGTTAVTTEEDLWTYSMPANTLSGNNKGVRITVMGTTAANGNTKTIKLYAGGTLVATASSGYNNASWEFSVLIFRSTGPSAEFRNATLRVSNVIADWGAGTLALDTTAAIVIKMSATNGTAVANDTVFKFAMVEALN